MLVMTHSNALFSIHHVAYCNTTAHLDAEVGRGGPLQQGQRRLVEGLQHRVQLPAPAADEAPLPQLRGHPCNGLGL